MTHRHDSTTPVNSTPFNPRTYRDAMGPGYGVATFREQAELTGHDVELRHARSVAVMRSLPTLALRRSWLVSLRHRLLVRIDHLLERSLSFTQARLSNIDDAQSVPNCC